MGDPCGIGPEVIAKALSKPDLRALARFTVFAAGDIMEKAFKEENIDAKKNNIEIIDVLYPEKINVSPGRGAKPGARAALKCIDMAAKTILSKRRTAMVTAPVSKKLVASTSGGFLGHTDYLRRLASSKMTTMVMVSDKLKVVPLTRHVSIKKVPELITADLVKRTLYQVIEYRKIISGKNNPVIGISGLNPHCGEGGLTGDEENKVIIPAINDVRKKYRRIEGPLSGDFIFYKALKKDIDIVVAMYHDQCLAPFKMISFDSGVNLTIGLGYIRTSPDHGTAFDIAGKGIASSKSMENAIKLAINSVNT